jgi:hypothetical protein
MHGRGAALKRWHVTARSCYNDRVRSPADLESPSFHAPRLLRLVWGLAQGMRHALEPDHSRLCPPFARRGSARSAWRCVAAWGLLGHAVVSSGSEARFSLPGGACPRGREPVWSSSFRQRSSSLVPWGFESASQAGATPAMHRPLRYRWHCRLPRAALPLVCEPGSPVGRSSLSACTARPGAGRRAGGRGAFRVAVLAAGAPSHKCVRGRRRSRDVARRRASGAAPMEMFARTRRGRALLLGTTGTLSVILGLAWAGP